MVKDNNESRWIEFNPNVRTRFGDEKSIRLTKSGSLALSPKVYSELLGEPPRVKLFYKEENSTKQIGICKAGDNEKGLRVFQIGESKSRYVSARRFFRDFKINFSENLPLKCDLDPRQQMVIADLPGSLGADAQKIVLSAEGAVRTRADFKKIDDAICITSANSVKSTGDITTELRRHVEFLGGQRWGPNRTSRFEGMIRNRIRKLVKEGRIEEVPTPNGTNTREKFYRLVQSV